MMKNFDLTNFEKVKDNVYIGVMTFKDYLSFVKENIVYESHQTILDNAELKAMEYNNNDEINEIMVPTVNIFYIEEDNSFMIFDTFATVMISNLVERFMNNRLVITFYNVNTLKDAGKINQQLERMV